MKNLLLYLVMVNASPLHSQNSYDAKWMVGFANNVPIDYFGGAMMDFLNPPVTPVYYTVPEKYSADKSLTMSDSAGNLLFFTNGCRIMSKNNEEMENGGGLNPGAAADFNCGNLLAYDSYNALLCVPYPNHPGEYLLFHSAWEILSSNDSRTLFYYTHIDMNANNGLGKVIAKNQLLYGPDWMTPATSAVRHANGRDWWIMQGHHDTHIFRRWLVSPQGVSEMTVMDWSSIWTPNQFTNLAGCFSPDGKKFVRPTVSSYPPKFFLYEFDRCSGELYNPVSLTVPDSLMRWSFSIFSPNSRFLYVANRIIGLYQFDLEAPDINASAEKVGEWDWVYDTTLTIDVVTGFHKMTHGPDGKIYICTYNHSIFLHVIHQPNEKGAACQFELRGVTLPVRNKSLPNYPNYQLYDVPGSPCDTLGINAPLSSISESTVPLHLGINPNPAYERITVIWPNTSKPVLISVSDVSGRLMAARPGLSTFSNQMEIDISGFPAGFYWVKMLFENGATGVAVFSVVR